MKCDKNCDCILCLELIGCEENLKSNNLGNSNFILTKPDKNLNELRMGNGKKYTFFGMQIEGDFEKFSTIEAKNTNRSECDLKDEQSEHNEKTETCSDKDHKHKSVIYVNDSNTDSAKDSNEDIMKNEYIDEWMSLVSREKSTEINVVFKNTFSLASQIINEVHSGDVHQTENEEEDDFPLGMEADLLDHYLKKR
ncbi:hypothetical protein HHI36_011347 [Cryptolaemus montrouzieri]|uniref:Uncharacterized protein n=1 Tax=Cryptolaemus montrouzieri TaxID=559131 RepID=A0ABD2MLF4_9CUCU